MTKNKMNRNAVQTEVRTNKRSDSKDLESFELELSNMEDLSKELRKLRSTKIKAGIQLKLKNEGNISRPTLLGYKYNKEIRGFEIDCNTSDIVRLIFKLYLEGHGLMGIAKTLNESDTYKLPNQMNWSSSRVSRVLKNPIYMGKIEDGFVTVHEKEYRVTKPELAIISEEIFNKVQEILESRKRKLARYK